MTFDVAADSYDRFMGRYAVPLAPRFADFAGVQAGQRALDVGCGPGAQTRELVRRLGTESVAAIDPSEPFVEAARVRNPGVDVQHASAEQLPFEDDEFDVALAQLVVHFMSDPVAGVAEMARVTRSGGVVAACVWDLAGERAPLSVFWRAARDLDPGAPGESGFAGAAAGQLTSIFERAGVTAVEEVAIMAPVEHATFDEWWEPYTLGVGPAGAYAKRLDEPARTALRERCRELLPEAPFTIDAYAWAARASA